MKNHPDIDMIIARTRCWIERVVVELNLCPFARKPYEDGQVRYMVSAAERPEELLPDWRGGAVTRGMGVELAVQ